MKMIKTMIILFFSANHDKKKMNKPLVCTVLSR